MSGSHQRQPSYPTHHSYHHSSTSHHHQSHSSHHRHPSYSHSRHQEHASPPSSASTGGGLPSTPPLGTPGPISAEDLAFLRQQQRSLGISPAGSTSTGNTGGNSRGLSLDPSALAALSNHFDNLLLAIAARVQTLSQQTLSSTQSSHRHATQIADRATVEIENLRDIMRQCDELETEFLKIKRLGEMVKGFRARIESLERRVGR